MAGDPRTPEQLASYLLEKAIINGDCLNCHLAPTVERNKSRQYVMVGGRGGQRVRATRLVWEVLNGKIEGGLWVLHKCDNPECINPEHLFLGTAQDNTNDMIVKGRKIDDPLIGERRRLRTWNRIKPLLDQGMDRFAIANKLGMSPSTVWNYINGPYKQA